MCIKSISFEMIKRSFRKVSEIPHDNFDLFRLAWSNMIGAGK